MIANRLANMERGWPSATASIDAVSQERAAERLNVSRSAVQRAKVVQERANPAIARRVDAGEVPVSVAAKLATMPAAAQALVADLRPGMNQHTQICGTTQAEAAAKLNVGQRTVQQARTRWRSCSPPTCTAGI